MHQAAATETEIKLDESLHKPIEDCRMIRDVHQIKKMNGIHGRTSAKLLLHWSTIDPLGVGGGGGDKVNMLAHTYPHKPLRKIKVTICNYQADSPLYVWPDVWSDDLQV